MAIKMANLETSGAALRTISAIVDLWQVSHGELASILDVPERFLEQWLQVSVDGGRLILDEDILERAGMLIGIYHSLHDITPDEATQIAWLRGPHLSDPFAGRAPLDLMMDGAGGLKQVHGYLGAWLAGNLSAASGVPYAPVLESDIEWR